MKTNKLLLGAVVLGMTATMLVAQQDRPPRREGGQPGAPGRRDGDRPRPVLPIIQALDLNSDGTIDANEIAKASESLKKLDKNNDGKLTPDELRPGRPGGVRGPRRGGDGGRPQRPPTQ